MKIAAPNDINLLLKDKNEKAAHCTLYEWKIWRGAVVSVENNLWIAALNCELSGK